MKKVYWRDGSSLIVNDGITWEYENDLDWLKTELYNPFEVNMDYVLMAFILFAMIMIGYIMLFCNEYCTLSH